MTYRTKLILSGLFGVVSISAVAVATVLSLRVSLRTMPPQPEDVRIRALYSQEQLDACWKAKGTEGSGPLQHILQIIRSMSPQQQLRIACDKKSHVVSRCIAMNYAYHNIPDLADVHPDQSASLIDEFCTGKTEERLHERIELMLGKWFGKSAWSRNSEKRRFNVTTGGSVAEVKSELSYRLKQQEMTIEAFQMQRTRLVSYIETQLTEQLNQTQRDKQWERETRASFGMAQQLADPVFLPVMLAYLSEEDMNVRAGMGAGNIIAEIGARKHAKAIGRYYAETHHEGYVVRASLLNSMWQLDPQLLLKMARAVMDPNVNHEIVLGFVPGDDDLRSSISVLCKNATPETIEDICSRLYGSARRLAKDADWRAFWKILPKDHERLFIKFLNHTLYVGDDSQEAVRNLYMHLADITLWKPGMPVTPLTAAPIASALNGTSAVDRLPSHEIVKLEPTFLRVLHNAGARYVHDDLLSIALDAAIAGKIQSMSRVNFYDLLRNKRLTRKVVMAAISAGHDQIPWLIEHFPADASDETIRVSANWLSGKNTYHLGLVLDSVDRRLTQEGLTPSPLLGQRAPTYHNRVERLLVHHLLEKLPKQLAPMLVDYVLKKDTRTDRRLSSWVINRLEKEPAATHYLLQVVDDPKYPAQAPNLSLQMLAQQGSIAVPALRNLLYNSTKGELKTARKIVEQPTFAASVSKAELVALKKQLKAEAWRQRWDMVIGLFKKTFVDEAFIIGFLLLLFTRLRTFVLSILLRILSFALFLPQWCCLHVLEVLPFSNKSRLMRFFGRHPSFWQMVFCQTLTDCQRFAILQQVKDKDCDLAALLDTPNHDAHLVDLLTVPPQHASTDYDTILQFVNVLINNQVAVFDRVDQMSTGFAKHWTSMAKAKFAEEHLIPIRSQASTHQTTEHRGFLEQYRHWFGQPDSDVHSEEESECTPPRSRQRLQNAFALKDNWVKAQS